MAGKSLEERIQRLEAVQEIQNVMGLYESYHTASMQEETVALFAQKTPGAKVEIDAFGVWEGIEGVRRFFVKFLGTYEKDLTGRIYQHDLTTPVIQVGEDGQSAKALWSSPGLETHWDPKTGKLKAMWAWGKYRMSFVKEDGKWKIWRMNWHTTFITPYDKGWTEEPMGEWKMPDVYGPDRPSTHFNPYNPKSTDFGVHKLIPAPPMPYKTWDEDE
ncbi:MAG: hypothetical protein A2144_00160 [Chloroflexi bacterium RBG_16_50_9]|nr:MAG: hypothetical protein A2144_00160 [Chloroflexi bacterium RBG_16_50_9]